MASENSKKLIFFEDLENIHKASRSIWPRLERSRIFITGGTGFFGRWVLRSLKHAYEKYDHRLEVVVLSRDPDAFRRDEPELFHCEAISVLRGEISDFEFPQGHFDYVIHAAADSSDKILKNYPITMCKSMVNGIQRVLDFACQSPSARVLFVSSGAAYGGTHPDLDLIQENWLGQPIDVLNVKNAYTEAKRLSEVLCTVYGQQEKVHTTIARCFSFIGPGLPLDANYAIGNFIQDVLDGNTIFVKGNGLERRSYLYTSDLVVWLLTLLVRGERSSVVNVGSEESYSIGEIATIVSRLLGGEGVTQSDSARISRVHDSYVPSTIIAREQYGLRQTVTLEEGIRRTAICSGWKTSLST